MPTLSPLFSSLVSWTGLQPLVLSGFLAAGASCSSGRLSPNGTTEDAPGPAACPTQNLPEMGRGIGGIHRALSRLADRGIDAESFHLENDDRFRRLSSCSPPQRDRFGRFQEALSQSLSHLTTDQISRTIEGFYPQIYVRDETSGEVRFGDSPAQRDAKRRLDLWIAAINHRAFNDGEFANRLGSDGRIRLMLALNSERMTPATRGRLARLMEAAHDGSRFESALREFHAAGYRDQFAWLRSYDGSSPAFEAPYWFELSDLMEACGGFFGEARCADINITAFPGGEVERLLSEAGLDRRYGEIRRKSLEELTGHFHELSLALVPTLRPVVARRILEDFLLCGIRFHELGVNPMPLLQERMIAKMVEIGWARSDAELMITFQVGTLRKTASRLDDYRGRAAFLREYRNLYEEILTQPLEDMFSARQLMRYSGWGGFVFNRSLSGLPVRWSELDAIRRQVQAEQASRMDWPSDLSWFGARNSERPQWALPSDLGLCGPALGGIVMQAASLSAQGRTLDDLVCNNVELIALLPSSMNPPHVAASALGAFGIVTLRNEGPNAETSWTPGLLTGALAHEAAHHEYFRENFDHDSRRLIMQGVNERRAHATGMDFERAYLEGWPAAPDATATDVSSEINRTAVALSNRRLDLPDGDLDAFSWRAEWDERPYAFGFHPGALANEDLRRRLIEGLLGPRSGELLDHFGLELLDRAFSISLSGREEISRAVDAVMSLSSPLNDADSEIYFLASHPLTRVINGLRVESGYPPLTVLAMDNEEWFSLQDELARSALESRLLAVLHRRSR